ncbi:hypothetical protein CGMCC3_g3511 [Colletotrichum fructicola]|uniref:Uncharacterized protein n=1 Tax=Colletotrichum fructicola (strain Nara gc5) TaxID=1213859 RepID=L2FY77_COLFN|nr:uncharacterized protein CGMCC3_g3511 [Colletotrichum fructicola]KAE9580512.1 hypothetical protein CGMCC3_g3511 [Colletotrichum fructicola]
MKITSILQLLFAVVLAICVKATRAQSEGEAPSPAIETSTDTEVDSSIDQRFVESGNQKRWRVLKKAVVPEIERDVHGARFYYPSIKERRSLKCDTNAEAEDSWKIFQRSEDRQMDYYSSGHKGDSNAEAARIRGRSSRGRGRGR